MEESGPQGTQSFLNSARWDAGAVRDDLRGYVVEHLGDKESGVLILNETSFLKKCEQSVGVARQYTGTAGRTENAQVGVFLAYASKKGAAFVDRALYLPRGWADDAEQRAEAGVPGEVRFATKGELAKEMLGRAFDAGVPTRWVVADTVYGTARGLRTWLEGQSRSYVMGGLPPRASTVKDVSGRSGPPSRPRTGSPLPIDTLPRRHARVLRPHMLAARAYSLVSRTGNVNSLARIGKKIGPCPWDTARSRKLHLYAVISPTANARRSRKRYLIGRTAMPRSSPARDVRCPEARQRTPSGCR